MDHHLTADGSALTLRLPDPAAVESFFAEAGERGAIFLTLERELKPLERLATTVEAPPRFRFELELEVVQILPAEGGSGTVLQLVDWSPRRETEIKRQLHGGESELSPIYRIREMNPNQRFRLAGKASRVERKILLRDSSPQVLMGLLNHPQIEDGEVQEIVKSTYASGAILKRVAESRKWMSNPEIRLLVVRSPKTPTPLAIKHLDSLRTGDLRMLAKAANAREMLRKAALKAYLKRTGQRGI